ncbi:c-type cytochrome [Paenirhodobacter populi]|uniref:Cytochrome c n=1 Tax=Paenirhodobacter populi TaxID=2306993 RepID=A0A443IPA5_9RHOB|nr:cytochrome c [Sinirhodobacter populi]RWR07483.1 cytochrome c [Sinirhodobacter populi]
MKITALSAVVFTSLAGGAIAQTADQDLIEQGKYIATMGDCAACHTQPRGAGKPYAGGYAIASPLGTIWSTNITPSREYGIGTYTEQDFSDAVRKGVLKDGTHLYPAMPYDAYAGITDADMKALYAYFMHGVDPVDEPPAQVTELPFPFNLRFSMAAWNLLYARGNPFTPDAVLNAQENRGKYIVDTLGHCASCHSPRGLLMGSVSGQYLRGGSVGPWYAPDITGDPVHGIGSWANEEIATYLKTGRAEGKAQAAGPMAEAVEHSFQHMADDDLEAIAAYLKTVNAPAASASPVTSRTDMGQPVDVEPGIRGLFPENAHDSLKTGAELYSGYCASCHQPNGAGSRNQAYPSLFHNSVTGAASATNLIATILYGVDREAGGDHVLMPHFNTGSYVAVLTDQEIADISNFVMETYGNPNAAKVTTADVQVVRNGGPVPFLARVQPHIPALMATGGVAAVIVLAGVILLVQRRRVA